MKWLFATLVGLNLIVFAGMIASKMLKQHMPVANPQQTNAPPTIIIKGEDLVVAKNLAASGAAAHAASGAASSPTTPATASTTNKRGNNNNGNNTQANANAEKTKSQTRPTPSQSNNNNKNNNREETLSDNRGKSGAKYKECSARVSMPEDDYHRIKGLLTRYPHAASRQVVDNGSGESAARMNVVFMQVSDQEASAIQGVVGRYGQLNRSACNR